jgi:hypothetical protein
MLLVNPFHNGAFHHGLGSIAGAGAAGGYSEEKFTFVRFIAID